MTDQPQPTAIYPMLCELVLTEPLNITVPISLHEPLTGNRSTHYQAALIPAGTTIRATARFNV